MAEAPGMQVHQEAALLAITTIQEAHQYLL